jgi:hypothetical protein
VNWASFVVCKSTRASVIRLSPERRGEDCLPRRSGA